MSSSRALDRVATPAPDRRGVVAAIGRLLTVCGAVTVTACFHSAQVWPAPLTPGREVTANFAIPRAIVVGGDVSLVVQELSGRVVAVHADTLVVRLNKVPEQPDHKRWLGREAAFTLDSTTTISSTGFDRSAIGMMAVAGIAVVFAFIGSLPTHR